MANKILTSSWSIPALGLLAGILAGGASPGGPLTWLWWLIYVPLFLGLDLLARKSQSLNWRLWSKVFGVCLLTGVGQAWLSGGWVVNTSHVYGHMPLPLAWAANLLGFGSLLGVETFFFLGVPFLLGWRNPRWGFFLVIFWSAASQSLFPRFFFWSYGQFLHPLPLLIQVADIVGSAGLNLLVVPLYLLIFAWLRGYLAPWPFSRREIGIAALALGVVFAGAAVYGVWRIDNLERAEENGSELLLAGIQPNFTLGHLASNPSLSHSKRLRNLDDLLDDTVKALEKLPPDEDIPKLVVWPESVYPFPYFHDAPTRKALEEWIRERKFNLVLTTQTVSYTEIEGKTRIKVFGSSVHIPADVKPDGEGIEVYHKMALIPFGETIPFAELIPAFGRAVKSLIPQISQFQPGKDYTVFNVSPQIRLAPMICFDVVKEDITRGMVKNGANLGLVMANLAWFGKTTVSELFEFYVRFRAVENRIPILLLSQNGKSVLLDATGRKISPRLEQFQEGNISQKIRVPETFSFYTEYAEVVQSFFLLVLTGLIIFRFYRLRQNGEGSE